MLSLLLLFAGQSAFAADWPVSPDPAPWHATEAGVQVQDVAPGDGDEVVPGATLEVHYTGMLEDGTVFDTSKDRGRTFSFRVGQHQVIKGWEDGLIGMRVGGTRRLVIPPDLGYGKRGAGPIPPDATLYFEVELLGLEPPRAAPAAPAEVPPEALQAARNGTARYADLAVGDGKRVKPSGRVCIDWASWRDGAAVEDTYGRANCTWYRLDDGDDLPAPLESALLKMRVGGRRQVVGSGDDPVVYQVLLSDVGK
ncbi:MAG: FKBP-type peptidyl-prolyl cis-trans isomerase [Myxococcota bacterium]